MSNDLVSIIMMSHDSSPYVEETVRSVMAQTYTNWELMFVDDSSQDDTIVKMMELKGNDPRFKIFQTVYARGVSENRNASLRDARGRWIAFLDVGDVWAPTKLERQIAFMEEHGYAFSYTCYGLMNKRSQNRGVVVGGLEHVTYQEMLKCCWPAYMTVMYDARKVKRVRVRNIRKNNDYALWLHISEKVDCYLLAENLATMRTPWGRLGRFLRTDKVKWRYEVYRVEEDLGRVTSFLYTIRNGWYGMMKWMRFVKRA